jgi:dihydroorotase
MKILIRQAKIIDGQSPHHDKERDVLIENGIIKTISEKIAASADKEIDGKNHILTNGFFDLHVNFREPGFEHKEDLKSGCKAAMAGGFTGVLQMPSTNPPVQSKSEIELIRTKTKDELVDVYVAGALSATLEGNDLSEMYDMFLNGARCFTDDKHSVQDSGLMLRALLYAKNFHGLIMSFPNDKFICGKGQMNEGVTSTALGLKGIPSLAEEVMIARDLMLCEYAETGIHFSTISTKGSVDLIRKAKAKGMKVTCDMAAHYLLLDDSHLEEFDTNFKTSPPLRTKEDIKALKEGLKDGTIDAICSDHSPEDIENKKKEFDLAAFGVEGLETAFAAAFTALKDVLTIEQIIEKITIAPRKILSIAVPKIDVGEVANLTLFNPTEEWTVITQNIFSKSKNNPFLGMKLTGKVKAVVNKGTVR